MQKKQIDDRWAFEVFADQHPHEAYELDPDRFWAYFHRMRPRETREKMIEFLEETDGKEDS